jgi:RNA polymerase sigma-70 factor (ECF subfamily)
MYAVTIPPFCLEEEMIWIQAAKSNPSKFGPLYSKYYKKIFTYIHQRVQDHDTSQDITSKVFIRAIQKINSFENKGYSFGSWLYRIAHNEICQEYRESKREKHIELSDGKINLLIADEFDIEKEERLQKLQKALGNVKVKYLKIIELRYFEELSFREIGIELKISENSAKVRCFRALEKLKEVYKKL